MERWKTVEGFPDYAVSHQGRVRRIKDGACARAKAGRLIKPRSTKTGYLFVGLYRDGTRTERYVHRLVAAAFIGLCPGSHQCNHRNGNKADNSLGNLEYLTPKENTRHACRTGLMDNRGERNGQAKIGGPAIVQVVRSMARLGCKQQDIADQVGLSAATIYSIVKRDRWAHVP